MIKKNPLRCKNILLHANNMVKYMPINKTSMNMINPIMDFTMNDQTGGGGGGGGGAAGAHGSTSSSSHGHLQRFLQRFLQPIYTFY